MKTTGKKRPKLKVCDHKYVWQGDTFDFLGSAAGTEKCERCGMCRIVPIDKAGSSF